MLVFLGRGSRYLRKIIEPLPPALGVLGLFLILSDRLVLDISSAPLTVVSCIIANFSLDQDALESALKSMRTSPPPQDAPLAD